MRTRNVFIDTSTFRQHGYTTATKSFQALVQLVREDRAHAFVTELSTHELDQHIRADCRAAATERGEFRKRHGWLASHLPNSSAALIEVHEKDLADAIAAKIKDFLQSIEACEIAITHGQLPLVVDAFMRRKPPFARPRKRFEFVDAIVLTTLAMWCRVNGERMYVISKDADFADFCACSDVLHHLPSLADFVDVVQRHDQHRLPILVLEAFESCKEGIAEDILEAFREHEFHVIDADDEEVEVTSAVITAIGEPQILTVDSETSTVRVDAKVAYTAEITYDDPSSGIWDREDGVMLFVERTSEQIERTRRVPVQILLDYEPYKPAEAVASFESVNDGQPFRVWLERAQDLK